MNRPLVIAAAAIVAMAAVAGPSAQGTPAAAGRPLYAGVPIQDAMTGVGRAIFTIDVPPNQAAHVTLTQQGIDLQWILRPANAAAPTYSLDYAAGPDGIEHIYPPIGAAPAAWQIIVSPAIARAERGEFTIALELAPADDRARAVAAARALHYLGADPGPESNNVTTPLAQQRYVAAAAAALAAGDLEQAAESTFQAGRTFDVLGDQLTAIEWQHRALDLFRRVGGRGDREGRVLSRLGDLSRKIGAMSDAERYFAEALPLARAARDPYNVVDVLNNSGLLLAATGRYDEAIDQLRAAIGPAQASDAASVEAALTQNLGGAYAALGDYDHAIEYYGQSIEIKRRLKLPRRVARSQQSLASAYFAQGDGARAETTIQTAIDLYDQSGDRAGAADARGAFALMLHASGDTDRALELFAAVQPTLHELQNRSAESDVLRAWAQVEIDRGDAASALAKADEALRLARLIASPPRTQKALYVRARALQQMDRTADAIAALVEAIDSIEDVRGALRRSDLQTSYLAAVRRYYDLYIDLLARRGAAAQAFEVSERARARTLLDGLAASASKISKGVDPTLLARRRAIEADLNGRESYRAELAQSSRAADRARVPAVERDIARLLDDWQDVRGRIRAASPAFAALAMPEPVDATRVQRSLVDADTALVAYYVGTPRSYAWVVDRQSITIHELPPASTIDGVARRYHESLSRDVDTLDAAEQDKTATRTAALGAQLAAIVWTPIAPHVRGKRLVIVADGVLQYVPFAALPDAGGRPLIVSHEIAYLPSASVLESIRQRSRPIVASAPAAVFADPVFSKDDARLASARDAAAPSRSRAADGESYGRLRFSRAEADAIHAVAPAAFEALDFAAAKQTLLSRDLRRYRILHFATHGTLNTEHPELSGLVFSLVDKAGKPIDGFLRLHEIYNLDLDADLVVLSACRTALGKEVHGEGLIGLTRGFIYAGAARVVSSVWNVDDRASARLMTRFYDAMLTRKLSPASALREAQLSLLREPRWANPHYWAAFSLQGEWK